MGGIFCRTNHRACLAMCLQAALVAERHAAGDAGVRLLPSVNALMADERALVDEGALALRALVHFLRLMNNLVKIEISGRQEGGAADVALVRSRPAVRVHVHM